MRAIIRPLVQFPPTWFVLKFFYKVFNRFKFEKDLIKIEADRAIMQAKEAPLRKAYSDLIVKDGPFKGMKYPDFIAFGSAMYPKLHGCYEAEINPELEKLLKNDYANIIDVGCAEGYYAVGLAMRKPNAIVYAYDINEEALAACKKMAILNKVDNHIRFETFCSPDTLSKFDFSKRSLVLCDCEGYEMELFTKEAVNNLKNCDVLVEMHDLYNERISPTVEAAFANTHNATEIYSQNTFKKMAQLGMRGSLTDDQVQTFFTERNGIMKWVVFTPKI